MKKKIITFTKHKTVGAYLNLDYENGIEYILNLDNIVYSHYEKDYSNGYGDYLSRLYIETLKGAIDLYRKDADETWNKIMDLCKE